MLDYLVIPTPFSDTDALITTLRDFSLRNVGIYARPIALQDRASEPQAYQANLIIKAEALGTQGDAGFLRSDSGNFLLLIAQADQAYFLGTWLHEIASKYRYCFEINQTYRRRLDTEPSDPVPSKPPFLSELNRSKWQTLLLKDFWKYTWDAEEFHLEDLARDAFQQPDIIRNATLLSGIIAFTSYEAPHRLAMPFLQQLTNQNAIDKVCLIWKDSRHPELEKLLIDQGWVAEAPVILKMLTAFKTNQVERLDNLQDSDVKTLLLVCEDIDPTIAKKARAYVHDLSNPALLKEMAKIWANTRESLLWQLLVAKKYLPPPGSRVGILMALKLGQDQLLVNISAPNTKMLLSLYADHDEDIVMRETAQRALAQLKRVVAQQAVCKRVIEQEQSPEIIEIAVEQGYLPAEPHQKALFFFLTEQWEPYDSLDFDHSQLQAAYQAAKPDFRRRLAEKIRRAGRPEYLEIISGAGYHFHSANISAEEAQLAVEILTANQDWASLWSLVPQTLLIWSSNCIVQLVKAGWQPATTEERNLFEALKRLVGPYGFDDELLRQYKSLPPTLCLAEGRLNERINGLAFSPVRPILAFGTSTGKIVIWNIQTAQREAVLTGATRSIRQITFTPNGTLICAEHTIKETNCQLYYWDGRGTELNSFGQHDDTITVLHALNDHEVVSSGRDGRVKLWHMGNATPRLVVQLALWPRVACVSEDGKQLALWLNRRIGLLSLPDLNTIDEFSANTSKVAHAMAFSSEHKAILAGRLNEGIAIYHKQAIKTPSWQPAPAWAKSNTVEDLLNIERLGVLARHDLVVAARNDGTLYFLDLPNQFRVRSLVQAPHSEVNSLAISPDQAFMAVGSSNGSFSLWDLRVLDIDQLVDKPLGQAAAQHLTALNLRLASEPALPAEIRKMLEYLKLVLQHQLRYNIELTEETPSIKAGFFDIEISEIAG